MFSRESAYSSTELPSPTTTTRTTTTVFVAEVTCVMCSRLVGTAVETHWPPVNSVLIQVEGSAALRRIALDRLRCPDCGGNTAPTEVTTRLLRRERPIDWQQEQPRRGRPPRWLVAQRTAGDPRPHPTTSCVTRSSPSPLPR